MVHFYPSNICLHLVLDNGIEYFYPFYFRFSDSDGTSTSLRSNNNVNESDEGNDICIDGNMESYVDLGQDNDNDIEGEFYCDDLEWNDEEHEFWDMEHSDSESEAAPKGDKVLVVYIALMLMVIVENISVAAFYSGGEQTNGFI